MTTPTKPQYTRGLTIRPDDVGVDSIEGEIKVAATAKKFQIYLDGALRSIVTETQTQTLTNKTLTSPVLNTGVSGSAVDTDITLAANSDTILASQKAVKTYVDTKTAAQNEASEISFVPAGTIAATDVQAMGEELDDDIQAEIVARGISEGALQDNIDAEALTRANADTTLQTNIDTEASNRTSADNTLQSNIDDEATARADGDSDLQDNINTEAATRASADTTLQTNITNHINDTTDAHAASAITNTPSGNLAATNQQSVNNELQSDIDTRVVGPASAVDEAITRYDGTTGKLVKAGTGTLSAAGVMSDVTVATQSPLDNSTKIASTEYTDAAVAAAVAVAGAGRLLRITTFNASGTWTRPIDCNNILVKVSGGGGNGGAGSAGGSGGGGGGAGGSAIAYYNATTDMTITVGAATGTSSVVTVGTAITVASAAGGTTGTVGGAGFGGAGGTGGIGTVGDELLRGQTGSSGTVYSTTAGATGGVGGTNVLFGGGARGAVNDGNGVASSANTGGGGGGGGGGSGTGGAGGTGRVVIYEYV